MQKPQIFFFVLGIIQLLGIVTNFDLVTSMIPGWHTDLLAHDLTSQLLIALSLFVVAFCYGIFIRRAGRVSKLIFYVHFCITIITLLCLKIPFPLFLGQAATVDNIQVLFQTTYNFMFAALIAFVVGQVFFGAYFINKIVAGAGRRGSR